MAEYVGSTAREEITPEERQLRLGQIYGLLITLARRKRAEQGQPTDPTQVASHNASVPEG